MEKKLMSPGFFVVGDLADVDILITTTPIPEFTKVLKDILGQIKIKKININKSHRNFVIQDFSRQALSKSWHLNLWKVKD